jgi:hypothetical protein
LVADEKSCSSKEYPEGGNVTKVNGAEVAVIGYGEGTGTNLSGWRYRRRVRAKARRPQVAELIKKE